MAAPHVAGVAALLLQDEPTLTPAQVSQRIVSTSSTNKITALTDSPSVSWDDTRDDTPNRLLYFPEYDGSPVAQPTGAWLEIDQSAWEVRLYWTDQADNEIKFQIERSTDLVNFQLVAEPFANQESFSEPIPSGSFFYRIRAVGQGVSASSFALFSTTPPNPPSGSESLSGTANSEEFFYESMQVDVPAGTTASGTVSATANADWDGWAFAEASISGPNYLEVLVYAEAEMDDSDSASDSFNNGPAGSYTLEIIYEAGALGPYDPDYSTADASATLSWQ